MKPDTALRLAILALEEQMKKFNFDANLKDDFHIDSPDTDRASAQRAELREAAEILKGMRNKSWLS